jgi:carbon starvation protein CstA
MIIILAVLALVVVKALAHSPWGVFSIAATIPIALFMGIYMRLSARENCRSFYYWFRFDDAGDCLWW